MTMRLRYTLEYWIGGRKVQLIAPEMRNLRRSLEELLGKDQWFDLRRTFIDNSSEVTVHVDKNEVVATLAQLRRDLDNSPQGAHVLGD